MSLYLVTTFGPDGEPATHGVAPTLDAAKAYVDTVMFYPDWDDRDVAEGVWWSDPCGAMIEQVEAYQLLAADARPLQPPSSSSAPPS